MDEAILEVQKEFGATPGSARRAAATSRLQSKRTDHGLGSRREKERD
jgi:hypothetical protein